MKFYSHFIYVLLFVVSILLHNTLLAQIGHGGQPLSWATAAAITNGYEQVNMPAIDIAAMEAEDAINDAKGSAYRFGAELSVDLTLNNSGTWETLANGDRIWRLAIYSKKAKTINLIYNQFHMPQGAKFYLYNPEKTQLLGAFIDANNKEHGKFSTGLIKGATTVLEYYEPVEVAGEGIIAIGRVVHGYRGFFNPEKGFGDSGSCNNNVNCPEGDDWQNEIRSVAMILEGGFRACTGAMINNVNNDCTPYFLTADHCLGGSVETWMFMFNYESPTCDNIDGPTDMTVSGATLLASNGDSDVALLEISSPPPPDYNVYYAGWSAEEVPATSTTAIHHPAGDIKKISFNDDPVFSSSGLSGVPDSHWEVSEWEDGTTEPGSSGSPMFDQNYRIIGQLHGGSASCTSITYDAYGKMSMSWDNGTTASSRLRDWLDPNDTGILVVDGKNCSEPDFTLDAGIAQVTSPASFLCNVGIIEPAIMIRNFGSEVLTSLLITYQLDGGDTQTFEWVGELELFETTTFTFPTESIDVGEHSLLITIAAPNGGSDESLLNNAIIYDFEVVTGNNIIVEFNTDFWGSETSIEILDEDGNLVYQESGFDNNTDYLLEYCLGNACYEFLLLDSYGDGIDNSDYQVISSDGTLLGSGNGNFGSGVSFEFCLEAEGLPPVASFATLEATCLGTITYVADANNADELVWTFEGGIPATATSNTVEVTYENDGVFNVSLEAINEFGTDVFSTDISILPNPSIDVVTTIPATNADTNDGSANISVSGGNAPYLFEFSNGTSGGVAAVSGLLPGDYSVTVTDANGCVDQTDFIITSSVGIVNRNLVERFSVGPNPANHFININVDVSVEVNYQVDIIDVQGKVIKQLQPSELQNSIAVNNLTEGIYLITIRNTANHALLAHQKLIIIR